MPGSVSVVKAIHDVDLERVLRMLGLYERLVRGELRCTVCGRPLIAGESRRIV